MVFDQLLYNKHIYFACVYIRKLETLKVINFSVYSIETLKKEYTYVLIYIRI